MAISESLREKFKARWQRPEYREKQYIAKKKRWANKESGYHTVIYKKEHSEAIKKLWLDPEFREKQLKARRSLEFAENMSIKHKGSNNHFWKGGGESRKYPTCFNRYLREVVKIRDKYSCQLCGIVEKLLNRKLHIHHIDSNKDNCELMNLVSLCYRCHSKMNSSSNFWKEYWLLFFGNEIMFRIGKIVL